MNYIALAFLFLIAVTVAYTAARLGLGIYQDYRAASEVRRQLLQRLRLLPVQPVLSSLGLSPQVLLYAYPLHDVERLIRDCESCRCKKACDAALGSRDGEFEFCPVKTAIMEKTQNPAHQPSPT
jgi:hypothetical protein